MRTDHQPSPQPVTNNGDRDVAVAAGLDPSAETGCGDVRAAAVADWQEAAAGDRQPPTGAQLARRYGMSPSWGRAVARHARLTLTANHPPGVPSTLSGGSPGSPLAPAAARVAPPDGPANVPGDRLAPTASHVGSTAGGTTTAEAPADAPPVPATAHASTGGEPAWVRLASHASLLLVVVAAAVASVDHLADVARLAGTTGWKVWLLPASVDGLATAAAVAVYRSQRVGQSAGAVAWFALGAGIAVSVAGNVIAVYPELIPVGQLKVAVGATPPLSLALAIHLTLGRAHR